MRGPDTKRVAIYTALFAGGSFLAFSAPGSYPVAAAGAAALASLFGNTLASDIHADFTARSLSPPTSSHLQQLVGNALASLIQCYVEESAPPNFIERIVPIFRCSEVELTALARAARTHWKDVQLAGESSALRDGELHRAFSSCEYDSHEPLISSEEWDQHLAVIATHARTWYGDKQWLTDDYRRKLADYVAPKFAAAVRELVKADLDPSVGTGGRVFIAIHLELLRVMSISIRGIDSKSDDVLMKIEALQQEFGALTKTVVESLSRKQKADVFDLVAIVHDEHERTRLFVGMAFATQSQTLDRIEKSLASIQTDIAKRGQADNISAELLDSLLDTLKRMAQSGEVRGATVMRLSEERRYGEAAQLAIDLAKDEDSAAARLGEATEDARKRAAARWHDAGSIAFISNPEKAADAFRRSISLDPTNPYVWGHLGQVYWWLGRLPDALRTFTHLWFMLPEGLLTLIKAVDAEAAQQQQEEYCRDHPDVSRNDYLWVVRGIVVAGLNIIEILRREPALISEWTFRIVEITDGPHLPARTPTEKEAPAIVEFFRERVWNLSSLLGAEAARIERRRILEALSEVAFHRDEFDQSDDYLRRAKDISVEQRDIVAEAVYLSGLGIIACERNQINTARSYLEQALAICEGDSTKPGLVMSNQFVTPEEAERIWHESEELVTAGIKQKVREDEIVISNLLEDEFRHDNEAASMKALKLKEVEGNAHGNLGHVAKAVGDIVSAKREYETSLRIHESIGFLPGIATTCLTLGKMAAKDGNTNEACLNWSRARELFVQIGAAGKAEALARHLQALGCK